MTVVDLSKTSPWPLTVWRTEDYRNLLGEIRDRDYRFVSFQNVVPAERHIVLRHDIDFDPLAAITLAAVEADLGISSTFFFMARSDCYNAFQARNADAITQVSALGHRIGLHLDAALYDGVERLEQGARAEIAMIEMCSNVRIEAVSFHRPSQELFGSAGFPTLDLPHTYEARFVHGIGYCADSAGEWRYGHPLDHPALAAGTALQLLAHPIWWALDEPVSPYDALMAFQARHAAEVDGDLVRACRTYAAAKAALR